MTEAFVVLARSPRPGRGKTRLRAALAGHQPGLVDSLVAAMVADTLDWATGDGRTVVVAGRGDLDGLGRLAAGARVVAQPEAPFGERVEHALASGFAAADGSRGVVQIGTDSPSLPDALIAASFEALRGPDDAALIPAADGGWVALGLARPPGGELAEASIRWSTAAALEDTVRALHRAGRRVRTLPPWYDVDDLEGIARLRADASAAERAPRTLAALGALEAATAGRAGAG